MTKEEAYRAAEQISDLLETFSRTFGEQKSILEIAEALLELRRFVGPQSGR